MNTKIGGGSAIYDFASEGTLEDAYKELPNDERLRVAVEVARGLRDLHSLKDEKGRTIVLHTDIAVRQYLKLDGKFQLNDFNTAGMVYQRSRTRKLCWHQMHKARDKVSTVRRKILVRPFHFLINNLHFYLACFLHQESSTGRDD